MQIINSYTVHVSRVIMCKILIFVAVIFSLSNSVKTEDCPSEYLDGEDDFCYHIGTKAMTQSEAEKYCESKNGQSSLAHHHLPSKPLKNRLVQIAKWSGDRKWWLFDCKELELVGINGKKFRINYDLDCSEKRKPVCEIDLDYYYYYDY